MDSRQNANDPVATLRSPLPRSPAVRLPAARLLAALLALALLLVACGTDDDGVAEEPATSPATTPAEPTTEPPEEAGTETEAAEVPTEEPAPDEAATLRVTTLFVCSEAHLAWGIDKGTFADEGLEIELVRTAGGAAGLAALFAGEADLSSTNPVSAMLAFNQGFPVRIVANSFNARTEGEGFAEGVVVHADSDIEGPEDLEGATVAVNEIGSQNDVFTRAWLRRAGVDPMSVNMVALPFPELVPAIEEGRVDAAMVTGSHLAQLTAAGTGRQIGNPLVDVVGPVSIAAYMATAEFVEEQPELVERFVAGLAAAVDETNDEANRDEVLAVMSEYCGAPAPALAAVRFAGWEAHLDEDELEGVAEVLIEEGMVQEAPDLGTLLADTARR